MFVFCSLQRQVQSGKRSATVAICCSNGGIASISILNKDNKIICDLEQNFGTMSELAP